MDYNINNNLIKSKFCLSVPGKDFNGKINENQDSFIFNLNINDINNFNIFCVLDGHGINGKIASDFINKYIQNYFKNSKFFKSVKEYDLIYNKLISNDYELIKSLFGNAENEMFKKTVYDYTMSGTTCLMLIQIDKKLICANIGDCRAILIKNNNNIINLSNDHKPILDNEKQRIISMGGKIEQYEEENNKKIGPYRVFLKNSKELPGITLSRSLGDQIAKSIGVINLPEIIEADLDINSKAIFIASDGIWEFFTSKKISNFIDNFYNKNDSEGAVKSIVEESIKMWRVTDIVIDDITCICLFF